MCAVLFGIDWTIRKLQVAVDSSRGQFTEVEEAGFLPLSLVGTTFNWSPVVFPATRERRR